MLHTNKNGRTVLCRLLEEIMNVGRFSRCLDSLYLAAHDQKFVGGCILRRVLAGCIRYRLLQCKAIAGNEEVGAEQTRVA